MALTALVGLAAATEHVERAHRERSLAARLSVALGGPARGPNVGAIEQALILSADHELNPSSFALATHHRYTLLNGPGVPTSNERYPTIEKMLSETVLTSIL